ncbi:hypothetical protein ACJA28_00655 [Mesomycoplasma moatsii]|uniref:hypothetical protein n=1 Tax=Mesomycoplasma moatsii TaxID=171287 RepID=UPI0038739D15
MGMGSWIYGDKIHAVLLMLRKGSTGSWIEVEYLVQEDNKEYFASKGIKNPGSSADGNFWSGSSSAIISEAVRSNISGAAFSYNYDTSDMKVTFALNAFGGYDAFGNSNNFHKNGQLITTSVWCGGQQFSGTSGPWRNNLWTETWGGYFDNSVIAAKGIKNTTASPLLLEGYDQRIQDASKGYDGRFTAVINNPTSWGNDTFNPTKTLNNSRWRIYMQTDDEAVNASNSTYYSNFSTSVDISQNYRLGLNQGAFGIPVLEYHNDNNNDSTIFNLNVMFMKNGSNNGIIINQKDRGLNTQNPSTYGYYTEAKNKNIEIDMSNEEKPIDEINEQYLTEKYKINSNPWYYSSFLVQNLKMVNVRDDALFYINPNIENLKQDQATFDLYVTIKYNETGNLRTISSEELKNNWNSEFRVCSVTLTGLKVANPTSAIIQTNLGMSNISALDFSLSKNNDEIKRIIFDKRNEIFNNTLPTDFELSNIVSIIEKNVANSEGTITITFSIDKYYNDKGLLEEVEPKNFTIKFIGFKADDRTTSINPQLTNVENILPSQYENNLELIKNSIINNIENVYSPLDINDIEIVFNEPNNLIGTINANIKIINSKALQNGNIQQEFSLNNVVLSGFKTAIQTKIVNPINAITIDLNNKTINESIDLIDELFIFNNLNNFFSGNYEINNVSKIKISKKEIDKVQKRINLEIELSENSAYDVKGNLINKKVKFETYIFNFKQEIQNEETKIISPIQALSLGLNNLSIQEAQNRITNQFILNNKNKFFTGYLNLQNINEIIDLNILISNNSLIVTFKLKVNTWADKNGQLGSTEKDFKTNINGFKKENNKTSNLAQIIGGILLVIGGVLTIGIITFMFIKSKNKKLKH